MDAELSKLLEDVVVVSRIVLNGEVVSTPAVKSEAELRDSLRRFCSKGLYYVSVRGGRDEARLLVKDGVIVACSLRRGGSISLGDKALRLITDFLGGGSKATIMRFNELILPEDALRRIRSASTTTQATPPAPRPPARPVPLSRERVISGASAGALSTTVKEGAELRRSIERALPRRSPKEELIEKLNIIGAPVKDAATVEGRDYVIIDLVCDEEKEIPPPNNIALATLRCYMECFNLKPEIKRVRVTVHHRKAHAVNFNLKKKEERVILKALGSIPELLWKYELFIDKYKYKIKRRGVLEVSLVLKRRGIYSTANMGELVKEIYERIKKEWRGGLLVKAKIGAWGMEFRYPS